MPGWWLRRAGRAGAKAPGRPVTRPALGVLLAALLLFLALSVGVHHPVRAYTPTPGPMIQVVPGTEPQISVRAGPGVDYPVVGLLLVGEKAPALGRTPGGNWILILYPSAPEGVGWVFFRYVQVINGPLPVVTPPPTPTEVIPTPDATLAAQFQLPTPPTRLPTFTPPPPLPQPTFLPPAPAFEERFPVALFLFTLFVFGGLGLIFSFLQER